MLRFVWVILICGLFVTSAGAGALSSSETLRYRVTIKVQTPEGLRVGTAVREASRYVEARIIPGQGGTFFHVVKGEAVVVDLGKRGILFSLMTDEHEAKFIFANFSGKDQAASQPVAYPYFQAVTFDDLSDPKTAKAVGAKSLNKIFGEGVYLKEAAAEPTDADVTYGNVDKWLTWLWGLKGYISGKRLPGPEFYEQLSAEDFKKSSK